MKSKFYETPQLKRFRQQYGKAMVRITTASGAALMLSACSVMHGDASKGTYLAMGMGTNFKGIAQTAAGYTAEEIDNATSFREATKTVRTALWAAAAKDIASSLSGAYQSTQNAKTAADVSKSATAAEVEKAAIEASTAEAALEAAPTTPTP